MGKVVFLGVEGAGKSTLTAALATYFKEHEERGWSLRPENREAFTFLERMPKRFAAGEFPAQTATFRHLRWSICYNDEPQRTLEVLDYPGEIYRLAFLDPADDPDPAALREKQKSHASEILELMGFLKEADQVFVLFNIDDAKNLETDNANIDAVWVTMSSIKILSALENAPELTLLITQADRLAQEGETVDDVEKLVQTHIPLIARRFKNLKKLLVSATDYNSERFGLLPLVSALLIKTELYQIALPRWNGCLNKLNDGIDALDEYDKLTVSAKAFDWFSDVAAVFTGPNEVWARFLKEFRSVKEESQNIQSSISGIGAQIDTLKMLRNTVHFEDTRKYIDRRIAEMDSRRFWRFFS